MTDASLELFDFRQNSALDDSAVSLRDWVRKSSSFFSDFWGNVSDFKAQISTGSTVTQPYHTLLEKTARENMYCLAEIKEQMRSVWCSSNRDLRIICGEMLGISEGEETPDDELTVVEKSLAQLFVENLADALGVGWMGAGRIEIEVSELTKDPHKAAIIRGSDLAIQTSIEIEMRSGSACIEWLLPKQKVCDLLDTVVDKRNRGEPAGFSRELVGKLPVEVVVSLGKTSVPMLSLGELSAGEIITLDRRIDQPLTATINDKPLCECWPGQIGNQQAIEVSKSLVAAAADGGA